MPGPLGAFFVYIKPMNQALIPRHLEPAPYHKTTGPLTGIKFVITGTLAMGTRDEVAAKLMALGAKEQSSVGKDTTYLIIGEAPGASKLTKAQKLGIQTLDEAQLTKLLTK